MDLVKTLLVYMTVLVTSSTMFSPALTPMPADYATATPPVVTATPYIPPATLSPTATAAVTATPAMTTLYVGDRGDNVRKMQTRLKELGYLTDKVDGVFGKNTLRAVERFQKYNNLTVDGIAGAKTLNKLYNDRNVVFAPVDVTPSPTPTQRPPATANVPIYYMSTTGERIYTDVVTLSEGRTTLRANPARVPAGYVLTSPEQVTVTVASNGTPTPGSVTFTYQKPADPTTAPTDPPTTAPTDTPVPPTDTPVPPTDTPVPPTDTPVPPTDTPVPPTDTPVPPTDTSVPPTDTPVPPTDTPVPPTDTPVPPTDTPVPPTDTPEPTAPPATKVPALPEYQSIRFKDGNYPVYTGPGKDYYRVDKATVGGGVCRLYGSDGDWLLMGYGTSDGGYRIGYITKDALPDDIKTDPLTFSANQVKLTKEARMIDDPIINAKQIGRLPAGSTVTVLAYLEDGNNWAYIEVADFNDQPARGFINRNNFE
ncbi:MAG: peptidoglycan-binding domain-containing protein [Christensenellales bacterium]|jgi:peptidoglycan hydrolase-like protein with peptidoglycan-binding domain|nr:peptidoglycan-binding protein [Clostridiales bacterium]